MLFRGRAPVRGTMGCRIDPSLRTHCGISRSSQCSITGVTKAVICIIQSMRLCVKSADVLILGCIIQSVGWCVKRACSYINSRCFTFGVYYPVCRMVRKTCLFTYQ